MAVIGIDFGNFNSYMCFIQGMDEGTRKGGTVYNLLPDEYVQAGLPSAYFFSEKRGEMLCENAMRDVASPIENRVRYLKRNMGKEADIGDREKYHLKYDKAIIRVVEHIVKCANDVMQTTLMQTTTDISLAYPADFSPSQIQYLISLVEQAKYNGRPIKVVGTIAEPAAAALDYLSEFVQNKQETTALVYDMGGGTTDIALVSVYPGGRRNAAGQLYYYDVIDAVGVRSVDGKDIGGSEFDDVMYRILVNKFQRVTDENLNTPRRKATLIKLAEAKKKELTDTDVVEAVLSLDDDYTVEVSRSEFEQGAGELLERTLLAMKEFSDSHANQRPDIILITGGSGKMPMVMEGIRRTYPEYAGQNKIHAFRPGMAIAYGAARFGTAASAPVLAHVKRDLGVRYYHGEEDQKGYIRHFLNADSELPFTGEYHRSYSIFDNAKYLELDAYEANTRNPDPNEPDRDYHRIIAFSIKMEHPGPAGQEVQTRMIIDKMGIVHLEAFETRAEGNEPLRSITAQLDV